MTPVQGSKWYEELYKNLVNLLKMFKNNFILLMIIFFGQFIFAQEIDINKGFQLLEKGDFEEAETFFYDYLKVDPENKTAKLCYGRAVG